MKVLIRFLGSPVGRLLTMLAAAALGLAVARATDGAGGLDTSSWYLWGVSLLLAVGLYGSASGIPADAVHDLRVVVTAVTVGVLLKTALIAGVMYVAGGLRPEAMILGVAVAQIDPLSVAALAGRSRMSRRAKSLLLSWASFDDPVTALLTVYLMAFALDGGAARSAGVSGYLADLGLNLGFAAAAGLGWLAARRLRRATRPPATTAAAAPPGSLPPPAPAALSAPAETAFAEAAPAEAAPATLSTPPVPSGAGRAEPSAASGVAGAVARMRGVLAPGEAPAPSAVFRAVATLVLAVLIAIAAWRFWMLGIALIGLFYRPGIAALTDKVTQAAFLVATFVLGMLLVDGVDLRLGLVLGCAAFGAQIVAGLLIARRLPRVDRVYLALGQQNGITAVILSLALEPYLPYAVSVVAPAILVVNLLHLAANGAFDRHERLAAARRKSTGPLPAPVPLVTSPGGSPSVARPAVSPLGPADRPAADGTDPGGPAGGPAGGSRRSGGPIGDYAWRPAMAPRGDLRP
ncbi:hypothetical protein Sru01_61690 [Sphaerisporangium rufum]|uniref:NhaP-type Na+/H+ or K+/H+ antiporter n=1 Tax=Sphaerisporangium rufum TaxID=1381558 RepID=A0A919RBZ3_9ACTN|nr:hypothetical protein [Sphaerisporangium rufum]GII81187.1 hypothetical protein Sru01_61690 [Sphaerisporangium rufum]